MKFVIFGFFIFLSAVATAFHVVIDPGHGGQDLGAVRDSFVESKIVLQIAEKVRARLQNEKMLVTTLTRTQDSTVALKDRVQMANELKADLFVSLHANTSISRSLTGLEFYFNSAVNPARKKDSSTSKNFSSSELIQKVREDFMFYDKTEKSLMLTNTFREKTHEHEQKGVIKRAAYYVVEHTAMPSVLVELGFISNRREARKLNSEEYQNEMAQLVTGAILEYKEKSDKQQPL